MSRSARSRPWFTYLLGALAIAAIVVAVIVVGPSSSTATGTTERTVSAQKGVVQSTVSGTGNLAPAQQLDLDFGASGTVTHVDVKAGDHVHEGDLLAEIDDTDATVTLESAQADLASAQAQLESAQAQTVATAVPATTTPAATTKRSGSGSGAASSGSGSGSGAASQGSGSGSGSGASSAGSTGVSAASKAASIASAQAALDKAKLSVEDAEQGLQDTRLRAPTSGTIASVSGAVGDSVSAGSSGASSSSAASAASSGTGAAGATTGAASSASSSSGAFIVLAKLHRMQMTVSFTESDIGKVKVGQSAVVTLSALTDVKLAAHVTAVAVLGSTSGDVVSYPVTLVLDQSTAGIKAGMTASAEVVVDQQSGISVPSTAITGRGGSGVVDVRDGDKTTSTRVTTGLAGDDATIVLSGLKAGDQVVIRTTAATTATGSGTAAGAGATRGGLAGGLGGTGGGAFPGAGGGFRGGAGGGGGFARGGG